MQCLYCDAELKPFRGLFDEDFCSREHREKYFSSFRKAVGLWPQAADPPGAEDTSRAPQILIEIVGSDGAAGTAGGECRPASLEPAAIQKGEPDPRIAGFRETRVTPADGPCAPIASVATLGSAGAVQPEFTALWTAAPIAEERATMLVEAQSGVGEVLTAPCAAITFSINRPVFHTPDLTGIEPPPCTAEAEIEPLCRQLASSPMAYEHWEFSTSAVMPEFIPSPEAMKLESDPLPEAGLAPAVTLETAPVDRPAAPPSVFAEMLAPALEIQQKVEGSSPQAGSAVIEPLSLAPSMPAAPIAAQGINSASDQRPAAPLNPSFGNTARIKNWRLRITFAKPA